MSDVIAEGDAGQSAQIGRNRAIDINNRPPGVDIETLKQSNPDTNRALDWFESRLESLQRENEELKRIASEKHDEVLALEAAAITPEMRERIERKLADMQAESPLPIGGELVDLLRDLLGEQDA